MYLLVLSIIFFVLFGLGAYVWHLPTPPTHLMLSAAILLLGWWIFGKAAGGPAAF